MSLEKFKQRLADLEKEREKLKKQIQEKEFEQLQEDIQKIADTGHKIELIKKYDLWDCVYYLNIITTPENEEIKQEINSVYDKFHGVIEENQKLTFKPRMKTIPEIIKEYYRDLGDEFFGYETKMVDYCEGSEFEDSWSVYRFVRDEEATFWLVKHEDLEIEILQVIPTSIVVKAWQDGNDTYYS